MSQQQPTTKLSQVQFQDKLNQVVRIIKQRQENSQQLIQYLQSILMNSQQLSNMMFLQDQISRHKHFLQKVTKKNQQYVMKSKVIHVFYQQNLQLNQAQKSLVRRVSARILQLFQAYNEKVEKYPMFQKEINTHYKVVKPKILKSINLVDRNASTMSSIAQLTEGLFSYLDGKFDDQCRKINMIIQLIENGEIQAISKVFVCQHCKQLQLINNNNNDTKQPIKPFNQQQAIQNEQKISSKQIQSLSQQTEQQRYFTKQKQKINQKLKAMRQQAKQRQTIKKKKLKFATKYYSLMHHAMDLHKGYFLDEMTVLDQNQQRNKILAEMEQRNRQNRSFIYGFIDQCVEKNMEEKIVKMTEVFAKLVIKREKSEGREEVKSNGSCERKAHQKKDSFDLVIERDSPEPLQHKLQEYLLPQPISHPQILFQPQQKAQLKSFRITNPNKKPIIPTPKSNPNLFSIKQFGQIGQSFNFVKINMKNPQIHRSRLPDISNRLFSMQEKQKSAKFIEKLDNNTSSNNHLLIIKTSLSKPIIDQKKVQKKKKHQEGGKNDNNMIIKFDRNNIQKIQKIKQSSNKPQQTISPMTISPINTITRSKKIRRSDSGNKIIMENDHNNNNHKGSFKTLQINYSGSIVKKIKNFGEFVTVTEDNGE